MSQCTAVLLMAYGSPNSLDEVEPYYRDIRGGRQPTAEQLATLTSRYRRVGGRTRLSEVTRDVASALQSRLNVHGTNQFRVYTGMKHWHPYISETVESISSDQIQRLIALPLAPHYSKMSIGGYRLAVEDAVASLQNKLSVCFIESWYANPLFIAAMAKKIQEAVDRDTPSGMAEDIEVMFSAHSLPERILEWGDLYPQELRQSCEAVARAAGLSSWHFAFQSAGNTGEPWLGPDIQDAISDIAAVGNKRVLIVPIGFVSDNLEIVFDIDTEAQELAQSLGINLTRTEMPNSSPSFIEALEDIVINGTGARIAKTE